MKKYFWRSILAATGLALAACGADSGQSIMQKPVSNQTGDIDLVWAINVGGPAYLGIDGTQYEAESSISGGTLGQMDVVKGSQDPALYQTYREGDIKVVRPLANGVYDISLHFAEPEDVEGGERVFDAFIGDERVIEKLDVMASRDGKVDSALTVTVPDVQITEETLDIRFVASVGLPMLNAIVVRNKNRPAAEWRLSWSDEFDQPLLDPEKWSIDIWPARKVNDEDQAYTPREKNIRIENGNLVIEAHKEDYEGASYSSGRVHMPETPPKAESYL